MKKLWAPWRLEYILQEKEEQSDCSGCIFCKLGEADTGEESLVLKKGQHAYVVMNKFPYTNGHLMVIPYRHLQEFTELTADELKEISEFKQECLKVLKKVYNPQGFNIGMNLGEAAGAGIAEHLHDHIVPRWSGDHNFMPVIGEVRVMMEHVKKTFERLSKVFNEE